MRFNFLKKIKSHSRKISKSVSETTVILYLKH
jgi:hypothetical protein